MTDFNLYVNGQLCDFDSSTSVLLQKETSNSDEKIVDEIEFSYGISIPTTLNNKRIFGFSDNIDVTSKFDKLYDCELYADGELIISGNLLLTDIDVEYYNGNIISPTTVSIKDVLSDRYLDEIKPHYFRIANLDDYNSINSQRTDNHIIYPYVLYGLPYNSVEAVTKFNLDKYTQYISSNEDLINNRGYSTLNDYNLVPAFNVMSIIKDMFETEGYTIEGNIFNNVIFKYLFQTYQGSIGDYNNKRNKPYYLKVRGEYNVAPQDCDLDKTVLINPTINFQEITDAYPIMDNPYNGSGIFYTTYDNTLLKFNAPYCNKYYTGFTDYCYTIYDGSDEMKSTDSNGVSIPIIPKSGWYRVNLQTAIDLPTKLANAAITPSSDTTKIVGGYQQHLMNFDFDRNFIEIHLMKGTPATPQILSSLNSYPNQANSYSEGYTHYDTDKKNTWIRLRDDGKYPQDTLYVGESGGGFNTDNFICGMKYGKHNQTYYYNNNYGDSSTVFHIPYFVNNFALRYASTSVPGFFSQNGGISSDRNYTKMFNGDIQSPIVNGYGFAMAKDDEKHYTNKLQELVYNKTNNTTSTASNVKQYNGLNNNQIYLENNDPSKIRGSVDTVVWLEQGDTLYMEYIAPCIAHNTNFSRFRAATDMYMTYNLQIGYINDKRQWIPSPEEPVPSFDEIRVTKDTNVNAMLPHIKCNEYLESFLKTFNLTLSRKTKNVYSIDFFSNNLDLNLINLDNKVNLNSVTFSKKDEIEELSYEWKNDLEETGYVHGNDSPWRSKLPSNYGKNDQPWNQSGYTGDKFINFINVKNGEIINNESMFSFNWYKTIRFLDGGTSESYYNIPVICDAEYYYPNTTYAEYDGNERKTDKTFRLFYVSNDVNYAESISYRYGDNHSRKTLRLIVPHYAEYIMSLTYGSSNYYRNMYDYLFANNNNNNNNYEIQLPVKLSNNEYSKLKNGTLFKLNDNLYRFNKIEGHDIMKISDATLTLNKFK